MLLTGYVYRSNVIRQSHSPKTYTDWLHLDADASDGPFLRRLHSCLALLPP